MQENRKSLIVDTVRSAWRCLGSFFEKSVFWGRLVRHGYDEIHEKSLICRTLHERECRILRTQELHTRSYRGICLSFLLLILPLLEYSSHKTLLLCAVAAAVLGEYLLFGGMSSVQRFGLHEVLILLLALFYFLSGIGAERSVETVARGIGNAFLLLLYFPASAVYQKNDQRRMLLVQSFALFLVSALGVFQYFSGNAELKWVDLSHFSDIGGRSTSFFSNPNILAVYLLLSFPLMLSLLANTHEKCLIKVWTLVVFALSGLCLVFTWSRGAWLGGMLALGLFAVLYSQNSRTLASLFLIPFAALAVYLPSNLCNRFFSIGSMRDSSTRYRFYVWKGVCKTIAANPFGCGVGEAAFSRAYLPFAVSGTQTVMHAHQTFLQICCEVGWGGLITFLLILAVVVLKTFAGHKEERSERRGLRLSAFCALAGCLTMGLFDHVWYHSSNYALFWIVCGFLSSGCKKEVWES